MTSGNDIGGSSPPRSESPRARYDREAKDRRDPDEPRRPEGIFEAETGERAEGEIQREIPVGDLAGGDALENFGSGPADRMGQDEAKQDYDDPNYAGKGMADIEDIGGGTANQYDEDYSDELVTLGSEGEAGTAAVAAYDADDATSDTLADQEAYAGTPGIQNTMGTGDPRALAAERAAEQGSYGEAGVGTPDVSGDTPEEEFPLGRQGSPRSPDAG